MEKSAEFEAALAAYVGVLCRAADQASRAEDRPRYEKHLAEAARMFKSLHADDAVRELKSIVARERHNYGWSFLSDEEGQRAEAAFDLFARLVERQ